MLLAEKSTIKYASWLFAIASVWAGVLNLVFGEFEPAHQPIQAWGDHIPGLAIIARIAALWLILGGLALLIRPAARVGAIALAALYAIFCLFPLPRVITAPHYMGHHLVIYIGVFLSVGQQLIVFVGAAFLCIFAPRSTIIQPSPIHTGVCDETGNILDRLARQFLDGPK